MTKRNPVSAPQNIWSDAQEVDDINLDLEQTYNNTIDSGIINNHIGNGILPETLVQNVLFNSALVTGILDGVAVSTQNQPSDTNLGNQLQITLSGSLAAGRRTVKVAVIGLDFQSNLQYETFVFDTNETQVSTRHFTEILTLLFNDFIGAPTLSMNLGGQIVISEANPFTLSRDTLLVAQNQQPNLFFRDFFVNTGGGTLSTFLQSALPIYNTSSLNIYTAPLDNLPINVGDITTQIGEKFVATTDNIQKITLLLSIENQVAGQQNNLVFYDDLLVSIYPLQSTVSCSSDIVPSLPIDFAPASLPLVQVPVNYSTLMAQGITLDGNPQPIDFIFSNTAVAQSGALVVGNYYAVTIKRSGPATQCNILVAVGGNIIPNSRVTTFTGTLWVDLPEEQMWFEVWTDAAKMTDGQAYDSGIGIIIPKTTTDPTTQATIDNVFGGITFSGGEVFSAVVSAITQDSDPVPDQRTGNPVDTVQQFVPQVQLLNPIDLTNLENASEPLVVGTISDKNIDFIDQANALLTSKLYSATMAENQLLIRIVDDPTDTVRFDSTVSALATSLLSGAFINAQFNPDSTNPNSTVYRVAAASLCSMIVGDVDGNGIIDDNDLNLLNFYLGFNMNVGLPINTQFATDGYTHTTFTNGYTTYTQPFANQGNIVWQLVNPTDGYILALGDDGFLEANPSNPGSAVLTSESFNFSTVTDLNSYVIVLNSNLSPSSAILGNYGGFTILSLDFTVPGSVILPNSLLIQKVYLTGDAIGQMLRADIDGDFIISQNDGYLLQNYIERVQGLVSDQPPMAPTTNSYAKIGSTFSVIRLTLEAFSDRTDDFNINPTNRASTIHPQPDIFLGDGYGSANGFANRNFYNNPSTLNITQQLSWSDSLVIVNSNPRLVPAIFSTLTGSEPVQNCMLDGIVCNVYPSPLEFDPGRVDTFAPDNVIIGKGEILRPGGEFYRVDFEVGTIVLEIPDGLFGTEKTIDIMGDFIVTTVDGSGNQTGVTTLGFPAMKFSNCSYVTANALANDQIRFSVAVQSFSPNTNGLSPDGYTGAIVDGKMGVNIDYSTGLLTLNFTNLYQDPVLQTLSTKVQVNVFLKQGGFNNQPLFVDSTQVQNLLSLVSVFSGANVGGPSALVNMSTDTTYTPGNASNWANPQPTNGQEALDRLAALLVAVSGGRLP